MRCRIHKNFASICIAGAGIQEKASNDQTTIDTETDDTIGALKA